MEFPGRLAPAVVCLEARNRPLRGRKQIRKNSAEEPQESADLCTDVCTASTRHASPYTAPEWEGWRPEAVEDVQRRGRLDDGVDQQPGRRALSDGGEVYGQVPHTGRGRVQETAP